jgi:antitoxin component of MazEF toxin-antitoxin module
MALLRAAHLSPEDDVRISVTANGTLTITAVEPPQARHKHKTIKERFANFNGEITPLDEADFGEDVGAEIWQ